MEKGNNALKYSSIMSLPDAVRC